MTKKILLTLAVAAISVLSATPIWADGFYTLPNGAQVHVTVKSGILFCIYDPAADDPQPFYTGKDLCGGADPRSNTKYVGRDFYDLQTGKTGVGQIVFNPQNNTATVHYCDQNGKNCRKETWKRN